MDKTNDTLKGRDDTMAAISKPVTGAFVLDHNKASKFLTNKTFTSADAIKRFNKSSKVGKVTSVKNK